MAKKDLLLVYQDETLPSTRVRALNLVNELQSAGITLDAVQYPKGLARKLALINSMRGYGAVLIQKKLAHPIECSLIRRASRRLLYDFDDAVYIRDDSHERFESRSRMAKFKAIASRADVVIAGNSVLAEAASKVSRGSVIVIPSAVPATGVPQKDYDAAPSDKVVLGWVGTKGNLHHLSMLAGPLVRLAAERKIALHVVSNAPYELSTVDVVNIPWSLEAQEAEIARFDIGLMPLPDNQWTRGKCAYKALQCMASAVPVVCSDVGANREIVGDGGIVAGNVRELYEALKRLVDDPALRRTMGIVGRRRVEEGYSIEAVGRRLAAVIRDVL